MFRKAVTVMLSTVFVVLSFVLPSFASNEDITGKWLDEDKAGKIEIFKAKDGKYYGKVIWLREPDRNGRPKRDAYNPKEALRSQPIIGLIVLKGFKKVDDKVYEEGTIYDPNTGKTYSCKITVRDERTLLIRGYVGVSLLGRTTTWIRA